MKFSARINILNNRNLKPILYGTVLAFFIIMAVFSALIISYHLDGNCLSSIVGGEPCPSKGFAEIAHHLVLPNLFSHITPIGSLVFSIILLITGAVVFFIYFTKILIKNSPNLSFAKKRDDPFFSHISPIAIRWLSRFENSPNLF